MEEKSGLITINVVDRQDKLLKTYLKRANLKKEAHAMASSWYLKFHKGIGYPMTMTGSVATLLSGIDLNSEVKRFDLTVLILTGCVTLLSATSSFFNNIERSNKHQSSSKQYADIQSDIEFFYNQPDYKDGISKFLEIQHEKFDIYESLEPNLHKYFIDNAKKKIEEDKLS